MVILRQPVHAGDFVLTCSQYELLHTFHSVCDETCFYLTLCKFSNHINLSACSMYIWERGVLGKNFLHTFGMKRTQKVRGRKFNQYFCSTKGFYFFELVYSLS